MSCEKSKCKSRVSSTPRIASTVYPQEMIDKTESILGKRVDKLADEVIECFDNILMNDDELLELINGGVVLTLKFTSNDTKVTTSIPKELSIKYLEESRRGGEDD